MPIHKTSQKELPQESGTFSIDNLEHLKESLYENPDGFVLKLEKGKNSRQEALFIYDSKTNELVFFTDLEEQISYLLGGKPEIPTDEVVESRKEHDQHMRDTMDELKLLMNEQPEIYQFQTKEDPRYGQVLIVKNTQRSEIVFATHDPWLIQDLLDSIKSE